MMDPSTLDELLKSKDERIRELERSLAEAEANLQAVITQQIDSVVSPGSSGHILLRQAQLAIQQSNEELERRVSQRTEDLSRELNERKQVEEALRKSEEKFAKAFQSHPAIMSITRSCDGIIIDINRSNQDMFGYPLEEVIGHTAKEIGLLVNPADHERLAALLHEQGRIQNVEVAFRRKTGEVLTILLSIEPIEIDGEMYLLTTGIDISDRKRVEEALRKSEDKFARAFQCSPAAQVIIRASDRAIIDANDIFLAESGYTREEAIGRTALELDLVDNLEDLRKLKLLSEQNTVQNQEVKARTKAGDIQTHLFSLEPIELNGEACFLVTSIDITERVRSEEALNERNAALQTTQIELINERNRLLAVMDALPIGVSIVDEQGGMVQANAAFEVIWGSERPGVNTIDDYRGYQAWWTETGQPVQPEEWASARAVQKGETVLDQFIQIQKFDGSRAYILNSAAPIRNAQGQITGSAVALMDITEFIKTQSALRESQERFRVALASARTLVYTCDRDLRYTWIYNPLHGFRTEDVLGKRDDEVLPEGAASELIEAKQHILETGQGGVREVKVRLDNQWTYYIMMIDPDRNEEGEITGLICSALDITEQRRAELENRERMTQMEVQLRLLEYREKERQQVAREIHDGPIQTLSGTIFNLQAVKGAITDRVLQLEMEQAVFNIKESVQQLREIMNELRPPGLIGFGLAKSVRMHAEEFHNRYPSIQLHLNVFEDGTLLPEMTRLALFRIYQESLNNIIKHADANQVWVRIYQKANKTYLKIRDNGHGFPVQPDLVNLTQLGHYGLAGMQERAEAIGGTFTVTSKPGEGTVIQVVVP